MTRERGGRGLETYTQKSNEVWRIFATFLGVLHVCLCTIRDELSVNLMKLRHSPSAVEPRHPNRLSAADTETPKLQIYKRERSRSKRERERSFTHRGSDQKVSFSCCCCHCCCCSCCFVPSLSLQLFSLSSRSHLFPSLEIPSYPPPLCVCP